MSVALPARPFQDLVLIQGGPSGLPRGMIQWCVCLWAYLFVLLLLVGGSHGTMYVGLTRVVKDDLTSLQVTLLVITVLFFAWAEGYRGFYKSWTPFVVRRCLLLPQALSPSVGSLVTALFAPFCVIGLFFASSRRLVKSYVLYMIILLLVWLVTKLDTPYHEIVDCGVATGLLLGTLSYCHSLSVALRTGVLPDDIDRPEPIVVVSEQSLVNEPLL